MADAPSTATATDPAHPLVDPTVHRLLAYISAVAGQGYEILARELEEFAQSPTRRVGRTHIKGSARVGGITFADLFSRISDQYSSIYEVSEPEADESWTEFLERLSWINVSHTETRVRLTALGTALLNYLDAQRQGAEEAVPLVLNADDPMAYPRIIGRIADMPQVLLVDAYVQPEDVWLLTTQASVPRILTSDKPPKARLAAIAATLVKMAPEHRPEIRVASKLHDRFIVPAKGDIYQLGGA